jgi:hypothetical protein
MQARLVLAVCWICVRVPESSYNRLYEPAPNRCAPLLNGMMPARLSFVARHLMPFQLTRQATEKQGAFF